MLQPEHQDLQSLFRRSPLPAVMGIVNVTPDSFSDGGEYFSSREAIAHAVRLVEEGASLLDIGGESTRPGSEPVSTEEEINRVLPVLKELHARFPELPLSIDTSKAAVAEAALDMGAILVNDVTAGLGDPDLIPLVAQRKAGLVLMHMQGRPKTMQHEPVYQDVVEEVRAFLEARAQVAIAAGVHPTSLALDPGIGFGKTLGHNLELMAELPRIRTLGFPLLLGVSRKRWIGELSGRPVEQRLAGSLAGAIACMIQGADILRVHDVVETVDALHVANAILGLEHRKG